MTNMNDNQLSKDRRKQISRHLFSASATERTAHLEKWRRSSTSSAHQPNGEIELSYQTLERKADVLPLRENHYEFSSKGVDITVRPADGTHMEDGAFPSETFVQFLEDLAKQKQKNDNKRGQAMNALYEQLAEYARIW